MCSVKSPPEPRSDIIRYIELYNEVGFETKTMTPLTYRRMPAGWKMIMTVTILLFAVIPKCPLWWVAELIYFHKTTFFAGDSEGGFNLRNIYYNKFSRFYILWPRHTFVLECVYVYNYYSRKSSTCPSNRKSMQGDMLLSGTVNRDKIEWAGGRVIRRRAGSRNWTGGCFVTIDKATRNSDVIKFTYLIAKCFINGAL